MSLETKYQSILDKAFRNHFPDWDTLSPLDPMKVIAESLSNSLGEIERRQTRFTEGVLDSLPALFSFQPKRAQFPTALLQLTASSRLTEPRLLPSELVFRFQSGDTTVYGVPSGSARVLPLGGLRTNVDGKTVEIQFNCQGLTDEFRISYLPETGGGKLERFALEMNQGEGPVEISPRDYRVQDHTGGLSGPGVIQITHRDAGKLLCQRAGEINLTLEFDGPAPRGTFYLNAFPHSLVEMAFEVELAELSGEPWEEIALPESAVQPPSELKLYFPEGHVKTISRIETDLLKLRHTDAERFRDTFFYNAVNHSLVIPAAHQLLQNYNGGVTVRTNRLDRTPTVALDKLAFQGGAGDYSAVVDKIELVQTLSPFCARESSKDYLKRFYGMLRLFNSQSTASGGLVLSEVRSRLLDCDEAIVKVDFEVEPSTKEVTIFLLTREMELGTHSGLSTATQTRTSEILNRILPLDYRWKIAPFRKVNLNFTLRADLELSEERLGALTSETFTSGVKQAISRTLRNRLTESTGSGAKLPKAILFRAVTEELVNRHRLVKPEELNLLDGLVRNESTGVYSDVIERGSGEFLTVTVECDTRIRLESAVNFIQHGAFHG